MANAERVSAATLVPPHRDRCRHERACAVAGDQQRSHVARHQHHPDQHQHDEAQRPDVADERHGRAAASRHALGERHAAQEEEPRRADDQPQASDLGGHLAECWSSRTATTPTSRRTIADERDRRRSRADAPCRSRFATAPTHGQAPRRAAAPTAGAGTRARRRSACRATDVPGGRARDSDCRNGRWPKDRAAAASRCPSGARDRDSPPATQSSAVPAGAAFAATATPPARMRRMQPTTARRARAARATRRLRARTRRRGPLQAAKAPCPPTPPPPKSRAPAPRRSPAKWSGGTAGAARIRRASRPPTASPRNAADPASRRSWRRSRAHAERPPSAAKPARAHRARERAASPLAGDGLRRQHRDVGQGGRGGMPIHRRAEQQKRVRAGHVPIRAPGCGRGLRQRGRDTLEGAIERQRAGALGSIEGEPVDVRAGLSLSVASIALPSASRSPRPSRCCRRSSATFACASRSGARNAFRARARASASGRGNRSASGRRGFGSPGRRQRRSRTGGSARPP